jgi:hypothetical protein
MPTIVQLRQETFTPLAALAGLIALAAGHELVLVGTYHTMTEGRLPTLRQALAPHRLVALLVDDHVPTLERALIADLLSDGNIPFILTFCDPPPVALTSWLDPALSRQPRQSTPPPGRRPRNTQPHDT